jgi:ZIP family zinc transporter
MFELIAAATATALVTGLGALPVAVLGARAERLRPAMYGLAGGTMAVAAVAGLILPALDEGGAGAVEVAGGAAVGIGFLVAARRFVGERRERWSTAQARTTALVFAVLFLHSLPEGFAIGTAYASSTEGLGLFVVVAIAVQNIPEGTSVAIPMSATGASGRRMFWAAVLTSAPQPVGAVIAYVLVEEIASLLPVSFGFAAGAMLALVTIEVMPLGLRASPTAAIAGAAVGAAGMVGLSFALGV